MLTCEPTSFLSLMIFMLTTSNNFYAFSYSNNQYIQDRVESVNWGGGGVYSTDFKRNELFITRIYEYTPPN